MRPTRRRPLTADEEDLWSLVVRTVRPLRPAPRKPAKAANESLAGHKPSGKLATTAHKSATPKVAAAKSMTGKSTTSRSTADRSTAGKMIAAGKIAAGKIAAGKTSAGSSDVKAAARPRVARPSAPSAPRPAAPPALQPIMRRELQKLARGRDAIDARIDLHGMTQNEAHSALQHLLLRCQADGGKFVLVITGKGRSDGGEGRGVLRRQVPYWLGMPEFRRVVAGFEIAHAGHGGEGALYVRLRKPRQR